MCRKDEVAGSVLNEDVRKALTSFAMQLRCPICLEAVTDPYSLPCNHCFCEPCIHTALAYAPKCPVCKAAAKKRHLRLDESVQRIQSALHALLGSPKEESILKAVATKSQIPVKGKPPTGKSKTPPRHSQQTTTPQRTSQTRPREVEERPNRRPSQKENATRESPAKKVLQEVVCSYSESIVPCTQESNSVVDLTNSLPVVGVQTPAPPALPSFKIGDVVQVMARTWPGINKLGGTAWITACNEDGTFNVKYVLGGRENNVQGTYISIFTEPNQATPVRSASRKRSLSSPFSPSPEEEEEYQSSPPRRVSKKQKPKEPIVILCSGLSHEEKNEVERCALDVLEATIVQDWTPDVTHIIVQCQHLSASKLKLLMPSSPSVQTNNSKIKRWVKIRSLKFLKALVSGRWIVSPGWIKDCLQLSKHVSEESYEVQGLLKAHQVVDVAKKARLLRENNILIKQPCEELNSIGTALFANHICYVHGRFASPLPPKHEICTLIRLGQGNVSTSWDDILSMTRSLSKATLPIVIVMENAADIANFVLPNVPSGSRLFYVGYEWVLDCISESKFDFVRYAPCQSNVVIIVMFPCKCDLEPNGSIVLDSPSDPRRSGGMDTWESVARALQSPTSGLTEDNQMRMEAYLKLNELVEEPDTSARVDAMTQVLPQLLRAFLVDLNGNPDATAIPLCLRALSYFMYHEYMARMFPVEMVQRLIDSMIHVIHNTTDQTIYLLCLWSLSKQNFDEAANHLVPRVVEVFCQACVNEFQSRKIQLHALFGLHMTLVKHPDAMLSREMLKRWCHVVSKCLSSSDKQTRDAARKIFQEMCHFPVGENDIVATCVEMDVLHVMERHLQCNRHVEAIHLWGFVIVLLRQKLQAKDDLLNFVLQVPEATLCHADSRVRLLSLQHWRSVVDIFRIHQTTTAASNDAWTDPTKLWLFRKPFLDVVTTPLLVCLASETFATVLSTGIETWHHVIAVAVLDFNRFCRSSPLTMDFCKAVMRQWKNWWDDIVSQLALTLLHRDTQDVAAIHPTLLDRTFRLLGRIWSVDADETETCESSSFTVAALASRSSDTLSISNTPRAPAMSRTEVAECLEVKASVAMLVLFQNALHFVFALLHDDAMLPESDALAGTVWHGLCFRIQVALQTIPSDLVDVRKAHRRLMTKCFAFVFGCQQYQTKTASLNPDASLTDLPLPRRLGLMELMAEKLDKTILMEAMEQSTSQLQPALIQKAQDHERDVAPDELEWLQGVVFTSTSRSSMFGLAIYCVFLEFAIASSGSEDVSKRMASIQHVFQCLSQFELPATTKQDMLQVSLTFKAMQESSKQSSSPPPPSESFLRVFRDAWNSLAGKQEPAADSSDGSLVSPCMMDKQSLRRTSTENTATNAIRPELVACKEPFSLIQHHFPQSFRRLLGFFNIKTIGDLCAKHVDEVSAMPLNDPINTVHKALDEYVGRRKRLNTIANKSPMKRKHPFSPQRPHPSPFSSPMHTTTPSPNPRKMKSAVRNLSKEVWNEGESSPRVADTVKFNLERSDGTVRIIRPGEDSQSVEDPPSKQEADDGAKMIGLASKLVSHLERCEVYVDRLNNEKSSKLPTDCWNIDHRSKVGQELLKANGIMTKLAANIAKFMEPTSSIETNSSKSSFANSTL